MAVLLQPFTNEVYESSAAAGGYDEFEPPLSSRAYLMRSTHTLVLVGQAWGQLWTQPAWRGQAKAAHLQLKTLAITDGFLRTSPLEI